MRSLFPYNLKLIVKGGRRRGEKREKGAIEILKTRNIKKKDCDVVRFCVHSLAYSRLFLPALCPLSASHPRLRASVGEGKPVDKPFNASRGMESE